MAMAEISKVQANGAWLATQIKGQGTPVVFLHAAVCDKRMWRHQVDAVAATHQAVAYDRRGFGESDTPQTGFSSVADLLAVLDSLNNDDPAILVGCSQGGRIALEAALAHPARFKGLFLIAPTLSGAPAPQYDLATERILEQQRQAELADDWERVNHIKARVWLDGPLSPEMRVSGDARDLFLSMNAIALANRSHGAELDGGSVYGQLGNISTPARVVWGDLDFPHIQQRSHKAATEMPNACGEVLHVAAHLPSLECPGVISDLLLDFIWQV